MSDTLPNTREARETAEATRVALCGAIEKWQRNLNLAQRGEPSVTGWCTLCELFHRDGDDDCDSCPVRQRTLLPGCEGTPWVRIWAMRNEGRLRSGAPKLIRAIKDEIAFLDETLRLFDAGENLADHPYEEPSDD